MTGWGQAGPYAPLAGHDINYIAISGALGAIGRPGEGPVPPLNLVGDFGGGGMMLAFGVLAALHFVRSGGKGQVVDCAMTDGSALLMAMIYGVLHDDRWKDRRGTNLLDGGAPYYDSYETADGLHIAIGAIEPQFYQLLRDSLGIAGDPDLDEQEDEALWPQQKEKFRAIFRQRTRAEWCNLLEGTDACFAPVLSIAEAMAHPHNVSRGTFITVGGVAQPAPAPRYSATPCAQPVEPPVVGVHSRSILDSIDP
jgi:alpha-methylacyl-CoA racemase